MSSDGVALDAVPNMWDLDLDRLLSWMDERGLESGPLRDVTPIGGGTQNVMLRLRRGAQSFVLRAPPHKKRRESDLTMRREVRVLAALEGSAVPHPTVIAGEDSADVLGASFYLMSPVDGFAPKVALPPSFAGDPVRQLAMGCSVVDAIAALATVPVHHLDPALFRDPAGWLERQPARWRRQLDSYAEFPGYCALDGLTGVDEVGGWLAERTPQQWRAGIIHGDYHFGNVIVEETTAQVSAIVDWELATIGDPLLDLGHLLAVWPTQGIAAPPHLAEASLPGREEILRRYASGSGRDVSDVGWYQVLACYRLGIILEGTMARASAGLADRETGELLHHHAEQLFAQALDLL